MQAVSPSRHAQQDAQVPFTPSHVAAVLPFVRTPLVPSALVVGSVAPDALYYVLVPVSLPTHTYLAAVTTDVVLGVVLLAGWWLVRSPLVAATPAPLRERLPQKAAADPRRSARVRRAVLLLVSLAVGALTHVTWDAFTHRDRWGTELVPWLQQVHGPLEGFRWAQYASGVVGLVALAWWAVRWWRRTPRRPDPTSARPVGPRTAALGWAAVALTTAAAGLAAGGAHVLGPGPVDARAAAFAGATHGGAAAVIALAVLALLVGSAARRP